jgi:hypothetical protein
MALIRTLFAIGPLLFGIGFLAPLIAQGLDALNWTPPLGITSLVLGLAVGAALGLVATLRGRWV